MLWIKINSSEYEWNRLSDLDIFYNNDEIKEYKDIRELGENYDSAQAQVDGDTKQYTLNSEELFIIAIIN